MCVRTLLPVCAIVALTLPAMSSASRPPRTPRVASTAPRVSARSAWYRAVPSPVTLRRASVIVLLSISLGLTYLSGIAAVFLFVALVALLTAITALWMSIRTLAYPSIWSPSVDLPRHVVEDDDTRRALVAIHDLADEHTLGKIGDVDYAVAMAQSRKEAKVLLREFARTAAPFREAAEAMARTHLQKHGLFAPAGQPPVSRHPVSQANDMPSAMRCPCASCGTVNDLDALFCKRCGLRLPPGT